MLLKKFSKLLAYITSQKKAKLVIGKIDEYELTKSKANIKKIIAKCKKFLTKGKKKAKKQKKKGKKRKKK